LYVQHNSVRSPDSVVGTALGYSLSDPGFEFRQGNEIVPFSKKSPDRIYDQPVGIETLPRGKSNEV
jgi:hypothetical protein